MPPEELGTFDPTGDEANAEGYVKRMLRLLEKSGVCFPDNRTQEFRRLDRIEAGVALHGEGEWANGDGKGRRVVISLGPQHGPVTANQAAIQDVGNPQVRTHLAHIAPDVHRLRTPDPCGYCSWPVG